MKIEFTLLFMHFDKYLMTHFFILVEPQVLQASWELKEYIIENWQIKKITWGSVICW